MTQTPLAYLNGRMVPFAEAALPPHDAGFVSGATVVDNARTFRHKLFRWPDHLDRFRRDCRTCYVPLEAIDEQLTAAAEALVAHNAKLLPPGGALQLVSFATPHGPSATLAETSVANFLAVIDGVVVSPPRETVLDGISLRVTRELCGALGIAFAEAPLTLADVHRTSEALLTGTGFCLAG